jgi:hypothetical protein
MIRVMLLTLFLTACGGSGGSGDGGGTSTGTGTTTPPPPPPEEGTVLDTSCDGTTLIKTIADGSGGSTEEETEQSEECGYEPASIVVTIDRGESDYFKGAIFTVDDPDNVGWDYEASVGNVIETDTGLEIKRDGNLGPASVVINGEEYFFEMVEEPICDVALYGSKHKIDCMGYLQGGTSSPMIYYGEDDTQVVQIEVGFVFSNNRCDEYVAGPEACAHTMPVGPEYPQYDDVYRNVEYFNEFNAKHGVYFEVVVSGIEWSTPWSDIYSYTKGSLELNEKSDMTYGIGSSGGYGGQAFQPRTIYPMMNTPGSIGVGMGGTMMHEIGHTMGLGHGVWNIPDWTYETSTYDWQRYMGGSIFPVFGHGWDGASGEGVCGVQGSVMSYGSGALWTNSLVSCKDDLGYQYPGAWGDIAGSRSQSDEAYALNRVRYSMSLYHNEHLSAENDMILQLNPLNDLPEDQGRLINDPLGPWVEKREAKINEEILIMRSAKQ